MTSMEQPIEIVDRTVGDTPVVQVNGEIDVATAPELRERLTAAIGDGSGTTVVDLLGVTFLDSTALGVLVGALKRVREAGGQLRLVIAETRVTKIFEITGLDEVFDITETLEEALPS